jgi:hypothetical protein
MAIVLNGTTGISGVNALSGVTTVSSTAASTPVVLQDSGSNTNTCRAWVNFNGTGAVAIRASFNVSYITDNATGDYTVNFTNALPDENYSITTMSMTVSSQTSSRNFGLYTTNEDTGANVTMTTSAVRLFCRSTSGTDQHQLSAAFFR